MSNSDPFDPNDEQLKLEMRAMAELLLDIYEYRRRSSDSAPAEDSAKLDPTGPDRTIKERSTLKPHNKIE